LAILSGVKCLIISLFCSSVITPCGGLGPVGGVGADPDATGAGETDETPLMGADVG